MGAAPPAALVGAGSLALDDGSEAGVVVSPLAALSLDLAVDVLVVLDVDVVCAEAASALVSVGGVISGVFLGTESDTLVLPQAPSAKAHSSAASAISRGRRALTMDPCACRTWGSR